MKDATPIDQATADKFLNILSQILPAAGAGANMDFTFLEKLQPIVDQFKGDTGVQANVQLLLEAVFGNEIALWNAGLKRATPELQKKDLSTADLKAELAKLRKTKVMVWAKKFAFQDSDLKPSQDPTDTNYVPLDAEIAKKKVTAAVQEVNSAVQHYKTDPSELDTQADILLQSLLSSIGG